jgi:hypothetical protein
MYVMYVCIYAMYVYFLFLAVRKTGMFYWIMPLPHHSRTIRLRPKSSSYLKSIVDVQKPNDYPVVNGEAILSVCDWNVLRTSEFSFYTILAEEQKRKYSNGVDVDL